MINLDEITKYVDKDNLNAIGLFGSYASESNKPYSDIDIVCFVDAKTKDNDIIFKDSKYIVISYVDKFQVENYFNYPNVYLNVYYGINKSRIIYEKDNYLSDLKIKIKEIDYNNLFKDDIKKYINDEILGWLEEVGKSLNGYILDDNERMINGLHGLTFGMINVLKVSEGIKSKGDNDIYKSIGEIYGFDSKIYQLILDSFGVKNGELKHRTKNGLNLFKEIIELINYRFSREMNQTVKYYVNEINKVLNGGN